MSLTMRTFLQRVSPTLIALAMSLVLPSLAHAEWLWHKTEGETVCCENQSGLRYSADVAASNKRTVVIASNGKGEKQINTGSIGTPYHLYLHAKGTSCASLGPTIRVNVWQWRSSSGVYGWHQIAKEATIRPTSLMSGTESIVGHAYKYHSIPLTGGLSTDRYPYLYVQIRVPSTAAAVTGCTRKALIDNFWVAGWR
jgi:hypothetical protein